MDKCEARHVRHSLNINNEMGPDGGRATLSETNIGKDLGVYIANDLKPAVHCEQAAAKAMRVVRMIHIYLEDLDVCGFRRVYKTYVRPQLEYVVQAWSLPTS